MATSTLPYEIKTNRNLLDNWYFVGGGSQQGGGQLPINQRGQTSYITEGYGIDRWKLIRNDIGMYVNSDCLRFKCVTAGDTGNRIFVNYILETPLPAGTYTISLLVKAATSGWYISSDSVNGYLIGNVSLAAGMCSKTFTATGSETSRTFYLWHQGAITTNDYLDIIAVKLEVGTEQTLAHHDGSGWVLNEVPDFASELAKCQRYYYDTGATSSKLILGSGIAGAGGTTFDAWFSLPVTMRSTVSVTATLSWVRGNGATVSSTADTTNIKVLNGSIGIPISGTFTALQTYWAAFSSLVFSAEM